MQLLNSYIFLKKEEKMTQDENGNFVIVIKDNVPTLFRKLFNAKDNDILLEELEDNKEVSSKNIKDLFYKIRRGKFGMTLNDDSMHEVSYEFICVNSSYYLDITIDIEKEEDGIVILEKINDEMIEKKNDINKEYVIVKSYDSVSEHYCNKIYPKLNKFERKLRKLLYLIYTGRFEKDYFKKTTSEEIQSSVKGRIQSKENNKKKKELDYAKVFFESFDFGELQSLLFEKRWTEVEEEAVDNFLKDNKKLSLLSDEEIRNFIISIKPKSDWERFFEDKGVSEDIAETIDEISKLRNKVAHNKEFNKSQHTRMNELLEKTEKEIDEAIIITETKDFIKINEEKIQRTLRNFQNNIKEMLSSLTEAIMPSIEKQTESLNEIRNKLKDIVLSSYKQDDDKDK